MANSKITIEFNKSFTVNQTFVYFYIGTYGSAYPTNRTTISKYWNNLPLNNSGEIEIKPPTGIIGEQEAIGFQASLVGVSGITVTRNQNSVTITSTNNQKYFVHGGSGYPNAGSLGSSLITPLVSNVKPNGLLFVSTTLRQATADFCQKAKATIATTTLSPLVIDIFRNQIATVELSDNLTKLTNKSVRFETTISGGVSTNKIVFLTGGYHEFMVVGNAFIVENAPNPANNKKYTIKNITVTSGVFTLIVNESVVPTTGNTTVTIDYSDHITVSIEAPKFLNPDDFSASVIQSPDDIISATILKSTFDDLVLEYSLDGIDWQSSNTFNSLSIGNYTLYVRDNFGCSFQKDFSVNAFGSGTLPYFYISKSNSIRFANRITWGDAANYKTDENTLSNEAFAKDDSLAYQEIQQFQSADVITTQFKSNYNTNTAKIIKSDLTEIEVPVFKKTNNMGVKDKRDARLYDLGNGKTGIYFTSGNTYDFDTNTVASTHFLNGTLPSWAVSGNYILVNNDWFLIEETVFDETKNADVIVILDNYSGTDIAVVAGSIYNIFNYDVYEFTIDMVNYIDQYFQVRINNTSPNFTEIIHLSEKIWCKVKHDKVLEIRYSNSTNTDMFYATGIVNLIRIPYTLYSNEIISVVAS